MSRVSVGGGLTLIELLVTLAILSILAAMTIPYAEITVRRAKEVELRRALREIRTAIDRLHEDWATNRVAKASATVSDNGYPRTLDVLVSGVERAAAGGGTEKYLRRIPRDPFAVSTGKEPWRLRSYWDEPDSRIWGGQDVYDVYSSSEGTALDGTAYRDW